MKQNVARKVKHYRLAKNKAYYSIFEAISNSIDSQNAIKAQGKIEVTFRRDSHTTELFDVDPKRYREVVIIDRGEGFTDKNFTSFDTSDSDQKEQTGGKGLGRFSWLKVFEAAEITSQYFENGKWYSRSFSFEKTPDGIAKHSVGEIEEAERLTTLKLMRQKKEWDIPKKITTFCEKTIEHFLPLFVGSIPPSIILTDEDSGEVINIHNYFRDNYRGEIGSKDLDVKGQKFKISIHRTKLGSSNQLILLANNRATKNINLAKYIIDLNAVLSDSEGVYYIIAFVSGEYLDSSVTPERDDFVFGYEDADDELSTSEIAKACASTIETEISEILEGIYTEKKKTVLDYVALEGPEYRYLMARKPEILSAISPIANHKEIEESLHRAEIEYKSETRAEVARLLLKDNFDSKEFEEIFDQISETARAELAKYILWRNNVISVLEKRIAWNDDAKFEKEDELHKLFYQMKRTSEDTPYETNNLWLIDERLNFHDYLASDIAIDMKNGDRPDIFTFNAPHYFNSEENPNESFSIIEFKRPNRNDFTDDENPIDQVYGYVEKIRDNKARRANGQLISVSASTPAFAYIICDLTQKLRSLCRRYNYKQTYDNLGFFYFNDELNVYVEVISYQKIAREAKNRNRVFMKKLGLK